MNDQDQLQYMRGMYSPHKGEDLLFVTITLKPKLYKYQALTQYELTHQIIEKLLSNTQLSSYVVELTLDCNVHYHAIVKFRDKFNRILFMNSAKKSREIGFIKITPTPITKDEQLVRTITYMLKDLHNTKKIISRNGYKPLLLKHYDEYNV